MKKSGFFQVLCLLFLVCLLLAGCGKKTPSTPPKDPVVNSIQFSLPDSYCCLKDGQYYPIPEGNKVHFYILTGDNEEEKVEAEKTFTGSVGSVLKFTLPDYLKGQKRYIYAVVELSSSYNLNGKTIKEAKEAAANGEILFGSIMNEINEASLVTLNINETIGNFKVMGLGVGNPESSIFFVMPETYWAGETEHAIPANREVKFYSYIDFDDDTFKADHTFSGTTGKERIRCTLPEELIGQTRDFVAVVILEGAFNLDGKKLEDIEKAVVDGKILLGLVEKEYLLIDGVEIDTFEFNGPIPNGVIRFEMPAQCVTGNKIPSGKPVKFYAVYDTKQPLEAEYVFEGTTGEDIIELTLPGWLMGEECYFMAIIVLQGDYDLIGTDQDDIKEALENKLVIFGQAKIGEDNKLFPLDDGALIDGFQFIDIAPPKEDQ